MKRFRDWQSLGVGGGFKNYLPYFFRQIVFWGSLVGVKNLVGMWIQASSFERKKS